MSRQGENLDLAMTKDEVVVLIGEGVCAVKTLTRNHLYCEPPPQQPAPVSNGRRREGLDSLPEFTVSSRVFSWEGGRLPGPAGSRNRSIFQVRMGNLNFSLGKVQYDNLGLSTFPLEAQIGVGVGASIVALIVLIIVLIYRSGTKPTPGIWHLQPTLLCPLLTSCLGPVSPLSTGGRVNRP